MCVNGQERRQSGLVCPSLRLESMTYRMQNTSLLRILSPFTVTYIWAIPPRAGISRKVRRALQYGTFERCVLHRNEQYKELLILCFSLQWYALPWHDTLFTGTLNWFDIEHQSSFSAISPTQIANVPCSMVTLLMLYFCTPA